MLVHVHILSLSLLCAVCLPGLPLSLSEHLGLCTIPFIDVSLRFQLFSCPHFFITCTKAEKKQ
ncbi:hypothetical protein EI94DRAFT_1724924 [Lactarius quietus]|nr:hypothetical protein EI94DRAFT_1724924 [Lactarius quietus]